MNAPIQHLVNRELVWFVCECGAGRFDIYDEVFDERGVTEHGFDCKCGKSYYFAYGSIMLIHPYTKQIS